MAFVYPKDRVLEHSTSNSQTVFAVTGAIDTSFNAFSASMSVGDTTIGGVVEPGTAFKVGLLTYSAANQVTVTTAYDGKGTFSAGGSKEVFMGLPASRAAILDQPNHFTDLTASTSSSTGAMVVDGGLGVGGKVNSGGGLGTSVAPTTAAHLDSSGMATIVVNNGANAAITSTASPGYQLIHIAEIQNSGYSALYLCGGGTTALIAQSGPAGPWAAPTSTPAAGKISVNWDGTNVYRVYNNLGSQAFFKVTLIKSH
jgi:hypothetical protein